VDCRKEQLLQGERTKFWRADDIGDVELLHARYLKYSFGRHTHEGLAVGVIRHGVESFSCVGSRHYAVADQIIVFNPDEVHTGEAADQEGWEFRVFYFDSELLRTAASLASGKQVDLPAFRNPVIDDPDLALQLCQLHAVLETEPSHLTRQELFLLTFAELTKRHADVRLNEPSRGLERQAVRRVREYLDANTRRNVALDELSGLSGLSPYHLIRVFRQELGLSPHAYFGKNILASPTREGVGLPVFYAPNFRMVEGPTRNIRSLARVRQGNRKTVDEHSIRRNCGRRNISRLVGFNESQESTPRGDLCRGYCGCWLLCVAR